LLIFFAPQFFSMEEEDQDIDVLIPPDPSDVDIAKNIQIQFGNNGESVLVTLEELKRLGILSKNLAQKCQADLSGCPQLRSLIDGTLEDRVQNNIERMIDTKTKLIEDRLALMENKVSLLESALQGERVSSQVYDYMEKNKKFEVLVQKALDDETRYQLAEQSQKGVDAYLETIKPDIEKKIDAISKEKVLYFAETILAHQLSNTFKDSMNDEVSILAKKEAEKASKKAIDSAQLLLENATVSAANDIVKQIKDAQLRNREKEQSRNSALARSPLEAEILSLTDDPELDGEEKEVGSFLSARSRFKSVSSQKEKKAQKKEQKKMKEKKEEKETTFSVFSAE